MKRLIIIFLLITIFLCSILSANSSYIHFQKGWNLKGAIFYISLKDFEDTPIVSIWKWENDSWQVWSNIPAIKELLKSYNIPFCKEINQGEGFWVNSSENFNFQINGNLSNDKNIYFSKGWNLLGLKTDSSLNLKTIINQDIKTIWKWENTRWLIWSKNPEILKLLEKYKIPELNEIYPEEGFWIFAESDGKIKYNNPEKLKIVSTTNNISIFDPIIVNFNVPLGYSDNDMKNFKLIAIIDNSTNETVNGKFKLGNNKKSIYFFPEKFLKSNINYVAIVSKEIISSQGSRLNSTQNITYHTTSDKKPVEIECDKEKVLSENNIKCSFKFNLKTSQISNFYWKINNNVYSSEALDAKLTSSGVAEVKIFIKDEYNREFSDEKDITVFKNIKNYFSTIKKRINFSQLSLDNKEKWESSNENDFYYLINQYKNFIVSINVGKIIDSKINPIFSSFPLIIVQMDKLKVSDFINNYFSYYKSHNNLIGVASFRAFPVIITQKKVKDNYYIEFLFVDGNISLNTSFNNNKLKIDYTGINPDASLIKLSFLTNKTFIAEFKKILSKNIDSYLDLVPIYFKDDKILYNSEIKKSDNWLSSAVSYVTDTVNDAVDEATDAVEDFVDTVEDTVTSIFTYLSQNTINILNSFSNIYNKIEDFNIFTKLGQIIENYNNIKSKLYHIYSTYFTDPQNVISSATDPDKLMKKLKEFLATGTHSVKEVVDYFKSLLENSSSAFSSAANILINRLNSNINTTKSQLENFVSSVFPVSENMYIQFSINSAGTIEVSIKKGTNETTLTLDTVTEILDEVSDWTSSVNFPLSDLKNRIQNIKQFYSNNYYKGVIGVYYDPSYNVMNSNMYLKMTLGKSYISDDLFKFVLSLKPSNPSLLIKAVSPSNTDLYIQWEFSPYSIKVPEANSDNSTINSLFTTLENTFTTENRPFPNGKITFHTKFLGKFDLGLTGELLPIPDVSIGVKAGIKPKQYIGIGGGASFEVAGGVSFPIDIGINNISIAASAIKSALNNFSFQNFNLCGYMQKIANSIYQSSGFQSILNDINFNLDIGGSLEGGAGGGGSEGGASANISGSAAVSAQANLITLLSILNQGQSTGKCFISFDEAKALFGSISDISLKKIPLLFVKGIKDSINLQNFSENFAQNFTASLNFGLSENVQANLGAGVDASITEGISFGVNGEYILNAVYLIIRNVNDSLSYVQKFDHATIFPEFYFSLTNGGEIEAGAEAGVYFKGVVGLSFERLSGKLTFTENPFLNNINSSYKIAIYPIVKINTNNSGTKNATFSSTIQLQNNTYVSSYKWIVNGVEINGIGNYENIGNIVQVNQNTLSINFYNHGEYYINLQVTDNKQRTSVGTYFYNIPNNLPSTPVLNFSGGYFPEDVINFTASTDIDNDNIIYNVQISKTQDFSNLIVNDNTTENKVVVPNVSAGTYFVRVRAYDGEDYSQWSNVKQLIVKNAPPQKPQITCVFEKTYAYEGVWVYINSKDSNNDELSYYVSFYEKDTAGNINELDNTGNNPIVINNKYKLFNNDDIQEFQLNHSYYVKVKAYDGSLFSEYSEPCYFVYGLSFTLESPENNATYQVGDTVNFTINSDYDEATLLSGNYYAEIEISTNSSFTDIVKTIHVNYDEMGGWMPDPWTPQNAGTYYIRVKLYKSAEQQGENDKLENISSVVKINVE